MIVSYGIIPSPDLPFDSRFLHGWIHRCNAKGRMQVFLVTCLELDWFTGMMMYKAVGLGLFLIQQFLHSSICLSVLCDELVLEEGLTHTLFLTRVLTTPFFITLLIIYPVQIISLLLHFTPWSSLPLYVRG